MNSLNPKRRYLFTPIFFFLIFLAVGCAKDQGKAIRLAVKSYISAPASKAPEEMKRVLAFHSNVLPDIEQEFHGASIEGRQRLLEVLYRLNDPEAIPFLRFVARWETDKALRSQAQQVANNLQNISSSQ